MSTYKTRLELPLPIHMADLPKDRRGYPIPFIALRDTDGQPHFTIGDAKKVAFCIRNDLCGLCGYKLDRGRWFVGGPLSAFHKDGWFTDPPMHADCMRWALQVCPYLALRSYAQRIEAATLDPAKVPPYARVMLDPNVLPEQPDVFCAVHSRKTEAKTLPGGMLYMRGVKPYIATEFWKDGKRFPTAQGQAIVMRVLDEAPAVERRPRPTAPDQRL